MVYTPIPAYAGRRWSEPRPIKDMVAPGRNDWNGNRWNLDVVIVGGGPSGLSAAIRLMQLASETEREISVCVVEKGSEIGAHVLSGAVFEPTALNELIPDWKDKGAPLNTPVKSDKFLFLTKERSYKLPTPPQMKNHGNYIVSLGMLCRWLAERAEHLGAKFSPDLAAAEVLHREDGSVKGVATGDMGLNADGAPGPNHEPGMELHAKYTIFAEGCRGHLTKRLQERFNLRDGVDPQTYGIGIKEVWEVEPGKHREGTVLHTVGVAPGRRHLRRVLRLSPGKQPSRPGPRRRP